MGKERNNEREREREMWFTAKAKSSSEGWGMGFLLVFFPEHEAIDINKDKTNLFAPSSSSSSSASSTFKPIINTLRRTTSSHLLSRAQSTISICALLIFITLLLFTLSTFEPTTTTTRFNSRRQLSSNPPILYKTSKKPSQSPSWSMKFFSPNSHYESEITTPSYALQRMGTLHRRGTKAMIDLIVGHIIDSVTEQELRLFLRLLHRSSLTSRSDLVLVFPSPSHSATFDSVIQEENDSFSKLLLRSIELNGTTTSSTASFDATQFVKSSKKAKEWGEPIWGRRIRSNYSEDDGAELSRLSYGSVVSFVVDELDPENSLAGFLDHVPMSLRRWACYPMLLGRVRRNFKHIMLVDVKEMLLLGDPLGRVRTRSPESVHLSTDATTLNKRGKKNSVKTQSHTQKPVNSALIMGGTRGVRRLSNAMLTEIVRATIQQKRKNPVTESGLFNQLVGNEFILKNANVFMSTESFPDSSSLIWLNSNSGSSSLSNYTVVRRGNSNIDINSTIMKHICSIEVDSSVYSDCL